MHEQAYIRAVVENIKDLDNVSGVLLEVGELAGIEANHLKEHISYEFGWDVNVLEKNATVNCKCGFKGRPKIIQRLHDFVVFECPSCGEIPSVLEGEDIKIIKVIYS